MPHTFFAHTGDLGVRLNGGSLGEVIASAAAAFLEAVTDPGAVRGRDEVRLSLRAPAPDLLLRDFLAELLFDLDGRGRLVAAVEAAVTRDGDDWVLDALTRGETLDPARHPVKVLDQGQSLITRCRSRTRRRDGRRQSFWTFSRKRSRHPRAARDAGRRNRCRNSGARTMELERLDPYRWRIRRHGQMRVDGIVYATTA